MFALIFIVSLSVFQPFSSLKPSQFIIQNEVQPLPKQVEIKKLDKIPDGPSKIDKNSYKNYQKAVQIFESCKTSVECQLILDKFAKYDTPTKYKMAIICNLESGWKTDQISPTADVGLCQVNAPSHCDKLGFDYYDLAQRAKCIESLKDPAINLQISDQIYSKQGFRPWNARKYRNPKTREIIFNVENLQF